MVRLFSITILFTALLLRGLAIPLGSVSHDGSLSLSKAQDGLQQALARLVDMRDKLDNALRSKAEFDMLFIKLSLERAIDGQRELDMDLCIDETCRADFLPIRLNLTNVEDHACACIDSRDYGIATAVKLSHDQKFHIGDVRMPEMTLRRRGLDYSPLSEATNFTYIPPPSTDITPQLIDQSLTAQPQNMATISSIFPHFAAGYVQIGIQLDSFVASTIVLNLSTAFPCENVGHTPQPDLEIRPKDVYNGSAKAVIPDCSLIAVNMYDPSKIFYWVQDKSGAVSSLVGSNKVVDIDKLNSTESVALVLRAIPAGSEKPSVSERTIPDGHQIFERALNKKSFSVPDMHTAVMSDEACKAITCNNNGGRPALFNPFTKTCVCRDPIYVETDHA